MTTSKTRSLPTAAKHVLVAAILAAAGLAGCSATETDDGSQLAKDTSGRAVLDSKSGEIVTPLSEYDLMADGDDATVISVALDTYTKECMTDKGLPYTAMVLRDDTDEGIGDRTYGVWNVRKASLFGIVPVGMATASPNAEYESDPAWLAALEQCGKDGTAVTETLYMDEEHPNRRLVDRIANSAANAAARDPEAKKAWEDWSACIKQHGLTPVEGDAPIGSQQAEAAINAIGDDGKSPVKEEEIRIATIEAQCDQDTKKTQRLADLEAAYQLPLIKENQAALNKAKTKKQAQLKAARDYIAQHG